MWRKNPSLLVALVSIVASTTIGILSIMNTKSIARLDKEVYVPNLQYRVGQDQIGSIYIEVTNYGQISAQNVVVSFTWNTIDLKDCMPSPPYQNVKPVKPLIDQNFSYRLEMLPVGGVFIINCKLHRTVGTEAMGLQVPKKLPTALEPSTNYPPTQKPSLTVEDIFLELVVTKDMLNVSIISDNSMPATEIGRRGTLLAVFQTPFPTATATPTFIP